MIVKNEVKVLPRFLQSIFPIIDWYTIIDTGSSDNTKKIIQEFFNSKNIPGEIYDHPFENFEVDRNFALEKLGNNADFGFIIDADETLQIGKDFSLEDFKRQLIKKDLGILTCIQNTSEWARPTLFKTSKPFYWKYPIHNALLCKESVVSINFEKEVLAIKVNTDGYTWTSQQISEKYLRSAEVLIKYIEKNGEEPRTVFYTAQCFRDGGNIQEALNWYLKRVIMKGGFYEEIYYSQLMIAQMKWQLGKPVWEVADEFMKCSELDDLKAEHLLSLKSMFEKNNRPKSALHIANLLEKYKGKNPYPNRVLLLNAKAYN